MTIQKLEDNSLADLDTVHFVFQLLFVMILRAFCSEDLYDFMKQ